MFDIKISGDIMNENALTKVQAVVVALVIVVALIAGAAYYFYIYQAPPAKDRILLGASLSLSGTFAYYGELMKAGFEFAIADYNAQGGVYVKDLGRKLPLDIKIYNDESDPTKATSNVERLITVDKVDFMLSAFSSTINIPIGTVTENYKCILIGIGTTAAVWEQRHCNYTFFVFHTRYNETGTFLAWAETLPANMRPRRLAFWQEDTELGKSMYETLLENLKSYSGYEIVYHSKYTPGAADYSSMILKTKEANPDVVFGVPSPKDAATLLRQSHELGFKPKLWWLQRAPEPYAFWDTVGELGNWIAQTVTGHQNLPIPKTQEITQRYIQKFGKKPGTTLSEAYAMIQVLVAAIEKAGSLDTEKVRNVLLTLSVDTTIGPVEFHGTLWARIKPKIMQWQNGEQQIVWPPELATAEFVYPMP
ncbi:MAG: amino acid ABC transporter substrate-binding protein [Candidatus Bathyarchaeia archaeon]